MKALLTVFAVAQLVIGALLWVTPGFFHDEIGPYGPSNDHYMGDLASWYLALGAVALVAVRRNSWRLPVLVFALALAEAPDRDHEGHRPYEYDGHADRHQGPRSGQMSERADREADEEQQEADGEESPEVVGPLLPEAG